MIVTMTAKTASEYADSRSAPVSSAATISSPLRYLTAPAAAEFREQEERLATATEAVCLPEQQPACEGWPEHAKSMQKRIQGITKVTRGLPVDDVASRRVQGTPP